MMKKSVGFRRRRSNDSSLSVDGTRSEASFDKESDLNDLTIDQYNLKHDESSKKAKKSRLTVISNFIRSKTKSRGRGKDQLNIRNRRRFSGTVSTSNSRRRFHPRSHSDCSRGSYISTATVDSNFKQNDSDQIEQIPKSSSLSGFISASSFAFDYSTEPTVPDRNQSSAVGYSAIEQRDNNTSDDSDSDHELQGENYVLCKENSVTIETVEPSIVCPSYSIWHVSTTQQYKEEKYTTEFDESDIGAKTEADNTLQSGSQDCLEQPENDKGSLAIRTDEMASEFNSVVSSDDQSPLAYTGTSLIDRMKLELNRKDNENYHHSVSIKSYGDLCHLRGKTLCKANYLMNKNQVEDDSDIHAGKDKSSSWYGITNIVNASITSTKVDNNDDTGHNEYQDKFKDATTQSGSDFKELLERKSSDRSLCEQKRLEDEKQSDVYDTDAGTGHIVLTESDNISKSDNIYDESPNDGIMDEAARLSNCEVSISQPEITNRTQKLEANDTKHGADALAFTSRFYCLESTFSDEIEIVFEKTTTTEFDDGKGVLFKQTFSDIADCPSDEMFGREGEVNGTLLVTSSEPSQFLDTSIDYLDGYFNHFSLSIGHEMKDEIQVCTHVPLSDRNNNLPGPLCNGSSYLEQTSIDGTEQSVVGIQQLLKIELGGADSMTPIYSSEMSFQQTVSSEVVLLKSDSSESQRKQDLSTLVVNSSFQNATIGDYSGDTNKAHWTGEKVGDAEEHAILSSPDKNKCVLSQPGYGDMTNNLMVDKTTDEGIEFCTKLFIEAIDSEIQVESNEYSAQLTSNSDDSYPNLDVIFDAESISKQKTSIDLLVRYKCNNSVNIDQTTTKNVCDAGLDARECETDLYEIEKAGTCSIGDTFFGDEVISAGEGKDEINKIEQALRTVEASVATSYEGKTENLMTDKTEHDPSKPHCTDIMCDSTVDTAIDIECHTKELVSTNPDGSETHDESKEVFAQPTFNNESQQNAIDLFECESKSSEKVPHDLVEGQLCNNSVNIYQATRWNDCMLVHTQEGNSGMCEAEACETEQANVTVEAFCDNEDPTEKKTGTIHRSNTSRNGYDDAKVENTTEDIERYRVPLENRRFVDPESLKQDESKKVSDPHTSNNKVLQKENVVLETDGMSSMVSTTELLDKVANIHMTSSKCDFEAIVCESDLMAEPNFNTEKTTNPSSSFKRRHSGASEQSAFTTQQSEKCKSKQFAGKGSLNEGKSQMFRKNADKAIRSHTEPLKDESKKIRDPATPNATPKVERQTFQFNSNRVTSSPFHGDSTTNMNLIRIHRSTRMDLFMVSPDKSKSSKQSSKRVSPLEKSRLIEAGTLIDKTIEPMNYGENNQERSGALSGSESDLSTYEEDRNSDDVKEIKQNLDQKSNQLDQAIDRNFCMPPSIKSQKRCPVNVQLPCPKHKLQSGDTVVQQYLVEAVKNIAFEYESDLARFVVRRPFALALEYDLWTSELITDFNDSKTYTSNVVDVLKPSSFYIASIFRCGAIMFVLKDDIVIRYHRSGETDQFVRLEQQNVGRLHFSNDVDCARIGLSPFDIENVYYQALLVRESYCTTLLSVTEVLRSQKVILETPSINCTDDVVDLPLPLADVRDTQSEVKQKLSVLESQPEIYFSPNISILAGQVLRKLFTILWGIVWFAFVRLPFMLFIHTFCIVLAVVVAACIRLYLGGLSGGFTPHDMRIHNQPGVL